MDRFYEEKASSEVHPDAEVTVATLDKKGIVIRKLNEDPAKS